MGSVAGACDVSLGAVAAGSVAAVSEEGSDGAVVSVGAAVSAAAGPTLTLAGEALYLSVWSRIFS